MLITKQNKLEDIILISTEKKEHNFSKNISINFI